MIRPKALAVDFAGTSNTHFCGMPDILFLQLVVLYILFFRNSLTFSLQA